MELRSLGMLGWLSISPIFFKDRFGPLKASPIRIEGLECNQLFEEGGSFLTKEFDMEEIINVVFSLKHNRAAGPDGLSAGFYQRFWEEVKFDLKELFYAFHKGDLGVERLNHGIIALIPKVVGVETISKI